MPEPGRHESVDLKHKLESNYSEMNKNNRERRLTCTKGRIEHLAALFVQYVVSHAGCEVVW